MGFRAKDRPSRYNENNGALRFWPSILSRHDIFSQNYIVLTTEDALLVATTVRAYVLTPST